MNVHLVFSVTGEHVNGTLIDRDKDLKLTQKLEITEDDEPYVRMYLENMFEGLMREWRKK